MCPSDLSSDSLGHRNQKSVSVTMLGTRSSAATSKARPETRYPLIKCRTSGLKSAMTSRK